MKTYRRSLRKNRKHRSRKSMRMCARNNVMMGGNLGMSYKNGDMIIPGVVATERFPSCGGVARPGMLGNVNSEGLPGMSGGKRRRRSMKGGRYTVNLEGAPIITGPQGGLADVSRIGCELGNSPTKSTLPMTGGAEALAPNYPYAFEEKTAGYTNKPSDFVTAAGSPIMLQIPEGGRAGPSCAMQGGRRRSRKHRSRKHRSRKHRSRKHRSRKH
jgi:hypothetical protein